MNISVNLKVAIPPPPKYSLTTEPVSLLGSNWIRASLAGIYCNKCCGSSKFSQLSQTNIDKEIDIFVSFHGQCLSDWERKFPYHSIPK